METITTEKAIELYNDMLDECYPELFGHSPSSILEEVDPIQYNCGLADYIDALGYEIED